MLTEDKEITNYIPQRHPFVMISNIISSNSSLTKTNFKILDNNIFVRDGILTEPALIENMAQTAAAGVGYQFQLKNEPIPNGFIGAIKYLQINNLPHVGETIETSVSILQEILGVTLIQAVIHLNKVEIASCEMKIVIQSSENE